MRCAALLQPALASCRSLQTRPGCAQDYQKCHTQQPDSLDTRPMGIRDLCLNYKSASTFLQDSHRIVNLGAQQHRVETCHVVLLADGVIGKLLQMLFMLADVAQVACDSEVYGVPEQ